MARRNGKTRQLSLRWAEDPQRQRQWLVETLREPLCELREIALEHIADFHSDKLFEPAANERETLGDRLILHVLALQQALGAFEDLLGPRGVRKLLVHLTSRHEGFQDLVESFMARCKNRVSYKRLTHEMAEFCKSGHRPDLLGDFYVSMLSKDSRKKNGVWYTPDSVCDFILDNIGYKPGEIGPDARLLDPACGSGAFLTRAATRLLEEMGPNGRSPENKVDDVLDRVWGVELDSLAATCARVNLALALLNGLKEDFPLKHFLDRLPEMNVHQLNALKLHKSLRRNDVPARVSHAFAEKFDYIAQNPPYVSYYGRGAQEITEREKKFYKNHFLLGNGRINTFDLFLEASTNWAAENGKLGFIVPNTLLINKSFQPAREFILQHTELKEIVNLNFDVFSGADVPTVIVLCKRDRNPDPENEVKVIGDGAINELGKARVNFFPQGLFKKTTYSSFNITSDRKQLELSLKIGESPRKLKDVARVRDGINTANVRAKYIHETREDERYKPLLEGRDINAYFKQWSGKFVVYDNTLIKPEEGEYVFLREEWIFTSPVKILTRQTADRIIAAIDMDCHYTTNSLHNTIPDSKEIEPGYLLGLMNSGLMDFWYKLNFQETGRDFPQVKIANLNQMPIHTVPRADQKDVAKLADKIVQLRKRPSDADDFKRKMTLQRDLQQQIDDIIFEAHHVSGNEREVIDRRGA